MQGREALIGNWSLVEYVLIRADGVVRKPWGPDVTGLLIYTPDGYMSANLMALPRKKVVSPDLFVAIGDTHRSSRYIGYAGRFSVSGAEITHHVEVSVFSKWVGLPQARYFEVTAERLVLRTPPIPRLGKHLVGQLSWKRVS